MSRNNTIGAFPSDGDTNGIATTAMGTAGGWAAGRIAGLAFGMAWGGPAGMVIGGLIGLGFTLATSGGSGSGRYRSGMLIK